MVDSSDGRSEASMVGLVVPLRSLTLGNGEASLGDVSVVDAVVGSEDNSADGGSDAGVDCAAGDAGDGLAVTKADASGIVVSE